MEEYELKKGHHIDEKSLYTLLNTIFGNVKKENNKYKAYYGAMQPIVVWLKDKNTLCIEINTDRKIDKNVALDTIKKRNLFLEKATGFTAKERIKRLQSKKR